MTAPNRVVVTGMGQVSALGSDLETFFARALAGDSGVRALDHLEPPGLERPIGAVIPDWEPTRWLAKRAGQNITPAARYAHAAATLAFDAARLDRVDRPRGGVYLGSGFGGLATSEETYRTCFSNPGVRPKPSVIPAAMANASAGLLASEFRLKGPNLTLMIACASGTHAIGMGAKALRAGELDVALVGGADAPLTPIILAAWNSMRVLAPHGDDPSRACRPFSADRQGLVVGEGAGFLVLETEAHATARSAPILAELLGYGANSDADHMTHPNPEGVRECMAIALRDAGVTTGEIDYINAHGTATQVNDRVESGAIDELFGADGARPMISSTKAVHGHAMGASGALEAILTVLSLESGRIPPTANFTGRDGELPELDLVVGEYRKVAIERAMSNSFAFGGNNAALVFKRA